MMTPKQTTPIDTASRITIVSRVESEFKDREVLNRCSEYFPISALWADPRFCPGSGEFKLVRIKGDQKGIANPLPHENSDCKTKQSLILYVS